MQVTKSTRRANAKLALVLGAIAIALYLFMIAKMAL